MASKDIDQPKNTCKKSDPFLEKKEIPARFFPDSALVLRFWTDAKICLNLSFETEHWKEIVPDVMAQRHLEPGVNAIYPNISLSRSECIQLRDYLNEIIPRLDQDSWFA